MHGPRLDHCSPCWNKIKQHVLEKLLAWSCGEFLPIKVDNIDVHCNKQWTLYTTDGTYTHTQVAHIYIHECQLMAQVPRTPGMHTGPRLPWASSEHANWARGSPGPVHIPGALGKCAVHWHRQSGLFWKGGGCFSSKKTQLRVPVTRTHAQSSGHEHWTQGTPGPMHLPGALGMHDGLRVLGWGCYSCVLAERALSVRSGIHAIGLPPMIYTMVVKALRGS